MKVLDYQLCVCEIQNEFFINEFYKTISGYLSHGYTPIGGLAVCDKKLIQAMALYEENK